MTSGDHLNIETENSVQSWICEMLRQEAKLNFREMNPVTSLLTRSANHELIRQFSPEDRSSDFVKPSEEHREDFQ